ISFNVSYNIFQIPPLSPLQRGTNSVGCRLLNCPPRTACVLTAGTGQEVYRQRWLFFMEMRAIGGTGLNGSQISIVWVMAFLFSTIAAMVEARALHRKRVFTLMQKPPSAGLKKSQKASLSILVSHWAAESPSKPLAG